LEGDYRVTGKYLHELEIAIATAQEAGKLVLDLYDRAAAKEYAKSDGSPVTDADLASDKLIRERLTAAFPGDALLTEEGIDDPARLSASRVWIVDPIDGTQQFVERTGEFDILIALVENGAPVVGVALQPTTGNYVAAAGSGAYSGNGSERKPLTLRPIPADEGPRIVTSHWFGAPASMPMLNRFAVRLDSPEPVMSQVGIYVRNFVHPVLEGDMLIGMEMTPDKGLVWEWDIAVADIVVNEAGGRFTDLSGRRFVYNKPWPRHRGGFVLTPDPVTHQRVLKAIAPELNEINNPS
jgi:3'-phosphoadenosine 5'-phosphosulfate (PAPS) 3'-phosphatase